MSFHVFHITEVYSNANGDVQYIEFLGDSSGQNLWANQFMTATNGTTTNRYDFLTNLPSSSTTGKSVLVATQGFADLGIVTPDYIIPNGFLFAEGGNVIFNGMTGTSPTGGTANYPAFPTDFTESLGRDTAGNATIVGAASPRNFANATAAVTGVPDGDVITGTSGTETLEGGTGDDALLGLASNDTLTGGEGDDRLDGGAGADSMVGGIGDDNYVVDAVGDVIVELSGEGIDYVRTALNDHVLHDHVDNLVLSGTGAIGATGNSLDNVLTGNNAANDLLGGAGNDTLNGLGGIDTLDGGIGDDSLNGGFGNNNDSISGGDGDDTLVGGAGNDSMLGGNDDDSFDGGTGNDTMTGGAGNDTLDGSTGNDSMIGGADDDTYVVDSATDMVVEAAETGEDLVRSSLTTYTLTANVESLLLTGSGNISGTGNSIGNTLTGNTGSNTLSGAAGSDTLNGGAGNDTLDGGTETDTAVFSGDYADYLVETVGGGVQVTDQDAGDGDDGVDLLQNIEFMAFADQAVEVDPEEEPEEPYTGTEDNDTYTGGGGDDTADGAGGDDLLQGLGGADSLAGGTGNDTLDGGAGGDTLIGGADDDLYVVDAAEDVVTEGAVGGGTDTVRASVSETLDANVEVLVLTGASALNGTGNSLANRLTGNGAANRLSGLVGADTLDGAGGNDTLDGGTGSDSMNGGAGNDVYSVDAVADKVVDAAGTDIVRSSVTVAALAAGIESLVLTGSGAINGTGNASSNTITGNGAANVLNGGAGADNLEGLGGNDTLVWAATDNYDGGAGTDTLKLVSGNLSLPAVPNGKIASIERIDMTGGGNNTLTLNASEVLDISLSTNTLTVLGNAGDRVNLLGAFTLQSTAGGYETWKLGAAIVKIETELTVL